MLMLLVVAAAAAAAVLQARELSELLDFAEQERLTLLEREAALQQELAQVRKQHAQLAVAALQSAALTLTNAAMSGKLLAVSQLALMSLSRDMYEVSCWC
jgi:hypothetical protein